MPTERRDYILRLIDQLAEAIGGLRGRLGMGAAEASLVMKEAQEAQAALLGPLASTLPLLDAGTAAALLRDRRQVTLWADYLRLEGDSWRLTGDEDRAAGLEARAGALEQAARDLWPGLEE